MNNEPLHLIKMHFGGRVMDPRGFKLAKYQLLGVSDQGVLVRLVYTPKTGIIDCTSFASTGLKKIVSDICFLENDKNLAAAVTPSGEIIIVDVNNINLITQL